ncbi:hypothetical protein L1049_013083 [Liquidambar formosana]|uniref:Transcription factor CBF/NF-Y/archaeal histone domain-containing protein n=1 Tax=Liquidambar formosana TaxID=63359 RepID=A0AAP0RJW1_LIQFO
MVLLTLTATLNTLRPQPCDNGSSLCRIPSKLQFAVLYAGIALTAIGQGGMRFTTATMGADQFDEPKNQGTFFNWFFFTWYTSSVISATVLVYIEDNVSWAWGFGLCVAANVIGLAIFLLGKRFYRHVKPKGSPFMGLARVVVATIRKRKVLLSSQSEDYYYEPDGVTKVAASSVPTKSFRNLWDIFTAPVCLPAPQQKVPNSMADGPLSPGGGGGSHESGEHSPRSNVREQDRNLPIANISRIMKKALPANGKIAKDAKETLQECVSEFISFVTSEASDKCQKEKRKTLNGDDLLWAMATLGFEDYIDPLKVYLHRFREIEGDAKGAVKGGDSSARNDAIGFQPGQHIQ